MPDPSPARTHRRSWSYRLSIGFALACALFGSPTHAIGQLIRGTLVQQGTDIPIEGAAIVLLSADDAQVAWTLTDVAGRFLLRPSEGGRYVLRADRIGHTSTVSDPLDVAAGDTLVYRMEAPLEPIELGELKVEGSSRDCRIRPEEGVATARVWEETRKALEAAARTTERGVYQFVLRRFDRRLDDRGKAVLNETSRVDRRFQRRPFRSLEAEKLIEDGFVQGEGVGAYYYAPDADVLLSDVFLDTHCFRLREGDDEYDGLLGLEFEPTGKRDVPEIKGTLWIDPSNAELQRLEYRYEKLDFPVGRAPIGGTLIFAGLPNGTWFIREWAIRMPILTQESATVGVGGVFKRGSPVTRVAGINEEGALVLRVQDARGNLVVDSEAGTVSGVVLDFSGTKPVRGATVAVTGGDQIVTTDDDGLFRIALMGGGSYQLRVNHPDLAALGYRGAGTPVQATAGRAVSARLNLPDRSRVLDEVCERAPDSGGIIAGWIENAATERAVAGAFVSVGWTAWEFEGGRRIEGRRTTVETTSRDDGFFIVCDAPVDTTIDIDVDSEGLNRAHETVQVGREGDVARPIVKMQPLTGGPPPVNPTPRR